VSESEISKEVLEYIAEHINSLEQLEILLLLKDQPTREWTAEAVFTVIQSSQSSVSQRLQEFGEKGLLIQRQTGLFQYAPKDESLAQTIHALSAAYKERRMKVIELIYRKPIDEVQSFADAFKLRKDKPNA
jgi:hypothetical protein